MSTCMLTIINDLIKISFFFNYKDAEFKKKRCRQWNAYNDTYKEAVSTMYDLLSQGKIEILEKNDWFYFLWILSLLR